MEEAKIYGLCLERLRYQIRNAKRKKDNGSYLSPGKILLESYNTGDIDEIVDILELYDVEERTTGQVWEKLEDLAYTVCILTREALSFGITPEGCFGLYLALEPEEIGAASPVGACVETSSPAGAGPHVSVSLLQPDLSRVDATNT
ncbi:MAG: hypothetical protein K8I29_01420 [Alphaproteobacteria bacterium]|uniref:Uncharacterized protein n=1 Tax=Candidatus Nitrobium versatile TaxID=2884831 RepID=A0A953J7Z3_9BACT|nr:hypothetical protein [Candidatus Nitrobium versatile]